MNNEEKRKKKQNKQDTKLKTRNYTILACLTILVCEIKLTGSY